MYITFLFHNFQKGTILPLAFMDVHITRSLILETVDFFFIRDLAYTKNY